MSFGIFGKLFGAKEVVDAGINAIDAMVFTDEEKSKAKLELLRAYEPFKIAQRYLAVMYSSIFLLAFVVCMILVGFERHDLVVKMIDLIAAFSLGQIVLAIVGFYFLGGVVSGFGRKK